MLELTNQQLTNKFDPSSGDFKAINVVGNPAAVDSSIMGGDGISISAVDSSVYIKISGVWREITGPAIGW